MLLLLLLLLLAAFSTKTDYEFRKTLCFLTFSDTFGKPITTVWSSVNHAIKPEPIAAVTWFSCVVKSSIITWLILVTSFFYYLFIRWDDDVVFKNCAKGDDGKKKVRHFACFL